MNQKNINNDMIIKRIEQAENYEWLKELIKSKYLFSNQAIDKIQTLPSLELQELLKKNYNL